MVKGTHKQMVVMRTNGNHYYEEVHFVLRDGRMPRGESERTMMAEANRILDECMLMPQPHRRRRISRWWTFAVGVLVGAGLLLALRWLF